MNRSRRAADHADRILALHAGVSDHVVFMDRAVANKSRIVVVAIGTGANTLVAPCATIKVDHHGGCTIDKPSFDQVLQ